LSGNLVNGYAANATVTNGTATNVVVANRLSGVFRTANLGGNWTAMDLAGTNEANGFFGINPGGQGETHFSFVADPRNATIIYRATPAVAAGNLI
jgi:hypothetical protein